MITFIGPCTIEYISLALNHFKDTDDSYKFLDHGYKFCYNKSCFLKILLAKNIKYEMIFSAIFEKRYEELLEKHKHNKVFLFLNSLHCPNIFSEERLKELEFNVFIGQDIHIHGKNIRVDIKYFINTINYISIKYPNVTFVIPEKITHTTDDDYNRVFSNIERKIVLKNHCFLDEHNYILTDKFIASMDKHLGIKYEIT